MTLVPLTKYINFKVVCNNNVIKAITNLGLLIQFYTDKLIGHSDITDYKVLPIEFYIAYDVIILLISQRAAT